MKVVKCKFCGAPIVWIKTQNGRSMPCDANAVQYANTHGGETADSPTFYPTCRFCGKQTLPVEKYASAEAAKTARQRLVQSYG